MTLDLRKRIGIFVVIMTLLVLLASVPAWAQAPTETYTYDMSFDRNGFTTVEVIYNSGVAGSGASWVAVPKNFTETALKALRGSIVSTVRTGYRVGAQFHAFYDNLTFSYASVGAPFSMSLRFNMTNGAMIVEPNGFFFSPQIGVSPSAKVSARLILPDGVKELNEVQPAPTQVEQTGSRLELMFSIGSQSRIAVTFKVSWAKQTSVIREQTVEAEVPSRYLDLGARMIALYNKAMPLMNGLFNNTVDRISVRFFTPLSLPDLSIGGYTPIDPSSFQRGAIYLNLFYFRALSGAMETIAIHELTHQYVARAGVSSDMLWVHEGLANYVAVQMGKPLGYDVATTDADLENAASELSGNYGIVQDWRPGGTITSLFSYYAASYHIFKTLGNEYGGLTLYSRFFRGLRELKDGLSSTNVAVFELGLAAGADLFPQFTKWGFELVDLSSLSARIAELRAEAGWYGSLLPFREEALGRLKLAERSMYSAPEVATGHITIAAFYIETAPIIIGGVVLLIIVVATAATFMIRQRRRKKQADSITV
jgi:hypothetical protein